MRDYLKFYIDGSWVDPIVPSACAVIDPATEEVVGRVSLGSANDVDAAVHAARGAFRSWARASREERARILERIAVEYRRRYDDIADAIMSEMGAPLDLAKGTQTAIALSHLQAAIDALKNYQFTEERGSTRIVKEPIGVCALITPWNWPINQVVCKVVPALAAGCTMVLKPSELAPFSAAIWAEILDRAGVPPGVFNLINGEGATVGEALARHPDVDMVSFTGSTRAGVRVALAAASTVKRVHQELGGKSPHIILDDASLQQAVTWGVKAIALNAGQNCNAPTRMLVPNGRLAESVELARAAAYSLRVGPPSSSPDVGPLISDTQWRRVQALINGAVEAGATLVAGGPGKPSGLDVGYYVRPTVFSDVTNQMVIAREEVFGPVLVIIAYDDVSQAIDIANDTPYGLAAYVSGENRETVHAVAAGLRAGQVNLNASPVDFMAPFGGYKQSGNGREWGDYAIAEFMETKAILGYYAVH